MTMTDTVVLPLSSRVYEDLRRGVPISRNTATYLLCICKSWSVGDALSHLTTFGFYGRS